MMTSDTSGPLCTRMTDDDETAAETNASRACVNENVLAPASACDGYTTVPTHGYGTRRVMRTVFR